MDYQNGRIYKIISDMTDKIYIGSTTQPLSKRLSVHKSDFKRYLAGKFRKVTSFELSELGPVQIVLIESYPCNNREELEKRECYYINEFKNIIVNKVHPTRTQKEYKEANQDEIKKQNKQYYKANQDKIKEQQKQYKEANRDNILENNKQRVICECGKEYARYCKSHHNKTKYHINYLNQLT